MKGWVSVLWLLVDCASLLLISEAGVDGACQIRGAVMIVKFSRIAWSVGLCMAYLVWPSGLAAQTIEKVTNSIPAVADTGETSTGGRIPCGSSTTGDDFNSYDPSVILDGGLYRMVVLRP